MQNIINFLRGNVYIKVSGSYPERFLNLCARNGIEFWDMSAPCPGEIFVRVRVADYKKIRPIAKKTMCHVHITEKRGLPFFTRKFRRRTALITGCAVFCVAAWVFTSFVWVIDIDGFESLDTALLRRELENNGVKIGAYSPSVDLDALKNDILIKMPELSYISINFNGSHAEVKARKRTLPPGLIPQDEPCHIVASRDGIITDIVVKSGTPAVVRGDTVMEGQLLASGYITGRAGSTVVTHADAEVRARTWHRETAKMPRTYFEKVYTGREKTQRTLIVFGKRIKLYFNAGISYKKCDKIIEKTDLTLPGGRRLPLSLETAHISEYVVNQREIPEDEAFRNLRDGLSSSLDLPDGASLVRADYTAASDGDVSEVSMVAECIEPIGKEQTLLKDG